MNTRTNLRTWRNNAHYIVQVGYSGSKTNPHIYAELRAIAVDSMSEIILMSELSKFITEDKLFSIADAKTAQQAIKNALIFFGKK